MHVYTRYQIHAKKAANIAKYPNRFNVRVNRLELFKLLLKEMIHYRGNLKVVTSRPCVYGVFSGPLGGFAPREELCVGCLRCTTEHPEVVQIFHNPGLRQQGDSYFTFDKVDTIINEAESGHVPVKGAGYRGIFGGNHWDGMWTDMSEIVRPTRDGIHGREYISTEVDLGGTPPCVTESDVVFPQTIPLPLLFDHLPECLLGHGRACQALVTAAEQLETFVFMPAKVIEEHNLKGNRLIPIVNRKDREWLKQYPNTFSMIEMGAWDSEFYEQLLQDHPGVKLLLRVEYDNPQLMEAFVAGVRLFHLQANYHGQGKDGTFVMALIREVHQAFVRNCYRDQVSLIGSGGMIAAEHIPKAMICGLDAIAVDTPVLAAWQATFQGECLDAQNSQFKLPSHFETEWAVQRLKNLANAWRDQLLEILGAMGLREVRRLRGEMGRALFQKELEREAFGGIAGYES